MKRLKRAAELNADARRRNFEQLAVLGGEVRDARVRRHWTQQQVAAIAGISRSAVSRLEVGRGGGQSLDTWQRVGLAVGRPLIVRLQRDPLEDTADAGHLAMQELVLRLGRRAGFRGLCELATRPAEPWRSTDVGLRDDTARRLWLIECWNSIGDIGAGARSSARKVAEAEAFAVLVGGEEPYAVGSCWVVRDTRRNRELVRRYPEVFAARFPGSSRGWVEALTTGAEAPRAPGLVWSDREATRLFAWRRR
jgi:transcriptional regulator with XRE-family HTH domain